MPRQPLPSRVVNSLTFILLAAFIGTVIPFLAFVTSDTARDWIDGNGIAVFWIGLAMVVILVVSMELQRIEIEPDARDVELMKRFRGDLGGDGDLMRWVRDWFGPDRFSEKRWHELEDIYRVWAEDVSRKFSDKKVQTKLAATTESLGAFISRTGDDTWPRDNKENDPGYMGLPPEWKDNAELRSRYYTAADEINGARHTFVTAHTALLKAAHDRGL